MKKDRIKLAALVILIGLSSCVGNKNKALEKSEVKMIRKISWLQSVDSLISDVNQLYQDDGNLKSYMKVVPEEALLVIHREKIINQE